MSHTISLEINNRTLSIEIGKIAKQADGSALVRYGDTIMLVTATSKKEVKEPKPFLPLIVDYRENTYAAGKIPGGFFKREGRPSEREILEARLIDRPIRPLFPDGYFFDTQIVGLLLSADLENEPDTLGRHRRLGRPLLLEHPLHDAASARSRSASSTASSSSIRRPSELGQSPLNMTVVGTEDGVVMIEAGAKEVEEERLIEGITLAHETIRKIVQAQKDLFAPARHQEARVHAQGPEPGAQGPDRGGGLGGPPRGHPDQGQDEKRGGRQEDPRNAPGDGVPADKP